ncbi:hypothetical protein HQ584_01430 [Patescibacteria group bacterium]|nr:hypothetical protein [Patescibacteria group bacterium]
MTKAGRPVFKGINSQAWAAMSLFLQYVNRQDFRHIGLEGDKLEDFHLVFEDGHKIICESKASIINYSQIRDILSRIIKHKQTNPEDDLLVICRKVSSEARSDIENFKFFGALLRSRLSKKDFTEKHLSLLPQVKFWEVTQEVNIESVELLVAELLKIWVPDHSLKEIVSSLVVNKIYFGSQKGTKLTKHEFLQQLEERKKQIVKDSGYYSERENKEKQIKEIMEALSDPNRKEWANNQLSSLTDKPDLHYFTLKKLEEKKNINLRDWDHLWRASARGTFSFEVFKIFKQNINNSDNKSYFLEFIPEIISKFVGFYTQRFLEIDIVRTCKEIINNSRGYDD